MKQKFLLSAVLLGALALGSCVDDKESASVTAVRNAKAEQLKSVAALNNAQAEAAKITANAEAALMAAKAEAEKAAAAKAQAEAEHQQLLNELQKLQNQNWAENAKLDLEERTAQLQKELKRIEAQILAYELQIIQNKAAIERAEIEAMAALNRQKADYLRSELELKQALNQIVEAAKGHVAMMANAYYTAVDDLLDAQKELVGQQAELARLESTLESWSEYQKGQIEKNEAKIKSLEAQLKSWEKYAAEFAGGYTAAELEALKQENEIELQKALVVYNEAENAYEEALAALDKIEADIEKAERALIVANEKAKTNEVVKAREDAAQEARDAVYGEEYAFIYSNAIKEGNSWWRSEVSYRQTAGFPVYKYNEEKGYDELCLEDEFNLPTEETIELAFLNFYPDDKEKAAEEAAKVVEIAEALYKGEPKAWMYDAFAQPYYFSWPGYEKEDKEAQAVLANIPDSLRALKTKWVPEAKAAAAAAKTAKEAADKAVTDAETAKAAAVMAAEAAKKTAVDAAQKAADEAWAAVTKAGLNADDVKADLEAKQNAVKTAQTAVENAQKALDKIDEEIAKIDVNKGTDAEQVAAAKLLAEKKAERKTANEALTKAKDDLKTAEKNLADAEKASELVTKATAADKALADAKTAGDKAIADAKTAGDKAITDAKTAADKAAIALKEADDAEEDFVENKLPILTDFYDKILRAVNADEADREYVGSDFNWLTVYEYAANTQRSLDIYNKAYENLKNYAKLVEAFKAKVDAYNAALAWEQYYSEEDLAAIAEIQEAIVALEESKEPAEEAIEEAYEGWTEALYALEDVRRLNYVCDNYLNDMALGYTDKEDGTWHEGVPGYNPWGDWTDIPEEIKGLYSIEAKIEDIKSQIEECKRAIFGAQQEINSTESAIEYQKGQIEKQKAKIAVLEELVKVCKAQLDEALSELAAVTEE